MITNNEKGAMEEFNIFIGTKYYKILGFRH